MTDYVIDASVAVKWLFLEEGSEQAEKLLEQLSFFFAPDLFLTEVDAVITKKVRQNELGISEAPSKKEQARKLPYNIIKYKNISSLSFELAITLPVTLYDATYLATAVENHATLYTADERLVNGLSNTYLSKFIKNVRELN